MRCVVSAFKMLVLIAVSGQCIAEEAPDAAGKRMEHVQFMDLLVVVKHDDGTITQVPIKKLKPEDRRKILDVLKVEFEAVGHESKTEDGVPNEDSLNKAYATLAEFSEFSEMGLGGTFSLRSKLVNENDTKRLIRCLVALRRAKQVEPEHIDKLLYLDSTIVDLLIQHQINVIASYHRDLGDPEILRQFHDYHLIYRELAQTLLIHAASNDEIAKRYSDRIKRLMSAPSPSERSLAAWGLFGANEIADKAVPALVRSIEEDVSKDVQTTSVFALGGFTEKKDLAQTALLRKLSRAAD